MQGDWDSPYECVEMEFSLWTPMGRGRLVLCASSQPWGRAAFGAVMWCAESCTGNVLQLP